MSVRRGERPLGLEAPSYANGMEGWIWNSLLDEMVSHETERIVQARKEQTKVRHGYDGLPVKDKEDWNYWWSSWVVDKVVCIERTSRHDTLLMKGLGWRLSPVGADSGVGILPIEHECGGHFSLIVETPDLVLVMDPYGSLGEDDELIERVARNYKARGVQVMFMGIQFQHYDDVINCGTWVAVLSGWVQMWACRFDRLGHNDQEREVEGLVPFILGLMDKYGVVDCRQYTLVASNTCSSANNSKFIREDRERFQEALPGRTCEAKFEDMSKGEGGEGNGSCTLTSMMRLTRYIFAKLERDLVRSPRTLRIPTPRLKALRWLARGGYLEGICYQDLISLSVGNVKIAYTRYVSRRVC